jgi:hypothetical protein
MEEIRWNVQTSLPCSGLASHALLSLCSVIPLLIFLVQQKVFFFCPVNLINVLFHLNIFREIRIHPPPNQTF